MRRGAKPGKAKVEPKQSGARKSRKNDDHGADLRRVPHEHGMTEPLQEGVEPDRLPGALNADRHGSGQGGIEVFDGRALVSFPIR